MITKETLTSSKKDIQDQMLKLVDVTFDALAAVFNSTDSAQTKLVSVTREYSDVIQEITKIKVDSDNEKRLILRDRNKLNADIEEFNIEKGKFVIAQEKADSELNATYNVKAKTEREIKDMEAMLSSLKIQAQSFKVLTDELESVKNQIKVTEKELATAQEELASTKAATSKQVTDTEKELADLMTEIATKRDLVFPTMEEVRLQKKELDDREAGLNIVIARYKKLYADQNSDFRI